MIKSKGDLKRYLYLERKNCFEYSTNWKNTFIMYITLDHRVLIWKYIKNLRKSEYYLNNRKFIKYLIYERRKNKIGNKLGFFIPPNTFDEGLTIYHQGNIVINPKVKVGKNCKIHGDVCIGNNGRKDKCPIIGDNVDIGTKACIIGDIKIGDNVVIGANAVVNKSFLESRSILVGVPAQSL